MLKLGTKGVAAIYRGSTPVSRIYQGSRLLFSGGGGGSFLRDWTVYGKSEVVGSSVLGVGDEYGWAQVAQNRAQAIASGITYSLTNGRLTASGTATAQGTRNLFNLTASHVYLVHCSDWSWATNTTAWISDPANGSRFLDNRIYTAVTSSRIGLYVTNGYSFTTPLDVMLQAFDLTAIFGSGNEPSTVDEFKAWLVKVGKMAKVTDDIPYFPYDAGSTFTSLPIVAENTDGTKSQRFPLVISSPLHGIGDVRDIMRYSDHGITRKFGVVDLGTLQWSEDPTANIASCTVQDMQNVSDAVVLVAGYSWVPRTTDVSSMDKIIKTIGIGGGTAPKLYFKNTAYSTAQEFKAGLSGVLLVYPLATPTFEPVTLPKLPAYRDGTVLYTDTQVHGDTIAGEAPVGFSLLPPVTMTPPTGDGDTNGQTDDTATE